MATIDMEIKGSMPPYYFIAEYLWGEGVDIDSDGNSETPSSTEWNELTLILRRDSSQRLDIDPIVEKPSQLRLRATNEELANSVYLFLQRYGAVK